MSDAPDAVTFTLTGWKSLGEETQGRNTIRSWEGEHGDRLSLHCFPQPDPSPFPLGDLDAYREFCRNQAASNGGGLVEADMVPADGRTFHRVIYKYPQTPSGFTFSGGLCLSPHFVVNVQAAEGPVTGARETDVANRLGSDAAPGFIARVVRGKRPWAADPYDPRRAGVCFRSDDRQWDAQFPGHPLSRVRRHLAVIESTVVFQGSPE